MIFNNYFIALNLHLEYFKRMFHVSKHLQGDRFLWSAKLVQLSVQLSVQLMHGNPNFLHLNQSKTGSDWQLTYLRIVRVSTCKWAVKLGRLKVDQEIPINSSVRQVKKSYNELATHSLLGEVPCHYDRQHKVTKKCGKDASDQVKISCSFFSSWWKCWRQFSWSITKWSKAKPNYISCITFHTYGKLLFSNVLRKYSKFY